MTKRDAETALALIDQALTILQRDYASTGSDLVRFRTDLNQARDLISRAKSFF